MIKLAQDLIDEVIEEEKRVPIGNWEFNFKTGQVRNRHTKEVIEW